MLALAATLLLGALAALMMRSALRQLADEHTLRGLFGEVALEALLRSEADQVIETAARIGRLAHFEVALRSRAWTGSPVHIDGTRSDWRAWTFPDGDEWTVRHVHAPRRPLRRAIVAGASAGSPDDLNVRAYVPGGADLRLAIVDALPPRAIP